MRNTHSLDPEGMLRSHTPPEVCYPSRREKPKEEAPIMPEKKNPLSICVLNCTIPMLLEKPLKLQSYDVTQDSDTHIEFVDDLLDNYHAYWYVKCMLFALILIE